VQPCQPDFVVILIGVMGIQPECWLDAHCETTGLEIARIESFVETLNERR
jgi:hypothetical protein